ncbi:OmpP1/FadL family transporter [Vibrio sp. WXL103]|uniref:OmpP1/FadL family transporter n=1 Tax=Vibrio sp. WXL103 TaxID=3450710 RepID=UPI003EC8C86F
MNKKNALFLAVTAALATQAHAGGIILHEVATFDSVSSAGVGNTTNRKDASAAITNPAGLTAIEDSSWSFGLQVVDAKTVLSGKANLPENDVIDSISLNSEGTTTALAPSIAYAKRFTDNLVLGASLHADGGLGMEYDNGLSGYGFVDSQSQEFVNVNLAAGYSVNSRLAVGGALVIQHMMTTMDIDRSLLPADTGNVKANGEDGTTSASFMMSTNYDISDRTYVSANYKHKVKHSDASLDLKGSAGPASIDESVDISVNWPSQLSFGIQHQLDHALTLKGMVGAEFWSDYSKELKTEDVYTIGTAIEYQHNAWTYQAGARYDTSFMKDKNLTPQLAVGDNWAVGFGAELKRSNGHRIGIAYQYRDMSTADTTHQLGEAVIFDGSIKENRLHALSLSYAY